MNWLENKAVPIHKGYNERTTYLLSLFKNQKPPAQDGTFYYSVGFNLTWFSILSLTQDLNNLNRSNINYNTIT